MLNMPKSASGRRKLPNFGRRRRLCDEN